MAAGRLAIEMDPKVPCPSVSLRGTQGNGVQITKTPTAKGPQGSLGRFGLPVDCKRILIVGAGGFGREVLQWAFDAWPDLPTRGIGFLSDDLQRLQGFTTAAAIVGPVQGHRPECGDYYVLGVGVAYVRRTIAESLRSQGADFATLVHPRAVVASSAIVGEGSIVCPGAVVSDASRLGACVLVNYHASLGHDASAGDYAVLSPYATLGGNASIADDVFLGLHASVGPGRRVGARSKVSANSCVLSDTPADSIIYGVPGRVVPRIEVIAQR